MMPGPGLLTTGISCNLMRRRTAARADDDQVQSIATGDSYDAKPCFAVLPEPLPDELRG
jgi:hypothetical protein